MKQKEREERERQERMAEEQRKRDEQQKAKKHASMFDDLMAGMAAKRRAAQMREQLRMPPGNLRADAALTYR